jgi:hypothetical protein
MENPGRVRYWHVSSSVNRASIERHGLDWRRMHAAGGIAAGADAVPAPEMEAVFLCETLDDVEFFVAFGGHPAVDVWEVDEPDRGSSRGRTGGS